MTIHRGTALPQSKLTERLVPVIRELHAAGITTRRLGKAVAIFELSTEMRILLRTPRGHEQVNRNGPEDPRSPPLLMAGEPTSEPSRHTRVAGFQGACLSAKPSARGVMPASIDQTIPGNAEPIAPWPVTPRGVSHAGNAEYPDRKTEEGHGEKGEVLPKGNQTMKRSSINSHPGLRPKRFYRQSSPLVARVARDLYFVGRLKQHEIGRMLGLSQGNVSRMVSGLVWRQAR